MIVEFLAVVQAAHLSFLPAEQPDSFAMPTHRGQQRLAGVDIAKCSLRLETPLFSTNMLVLIGRQQSAERPKVGNGFSVASACR